MRKRKQLLLTLVIAITGILALVLAVCYRPLPRNPFSPEDFVYQGDYLTCLSTPAVRGIDVSQHQGEIDWAAVKASGVEFVILRAGYRGYGSGTLHPDEKAQENYAAAKAAGLKIGAYFFSQAISPEEAREEAAFFLEQIRTWELDLWAVYDWEYISAEARTAQVDARTLTACTQAFLDTVIQAGCRPMVYFNRSQSETRLIMPELKEYGFWLAMYRDPIDTFAHRPDMWQYTNTGTVPGISGNVDINLWFPWDDGVS